jgi:hypothetical protein
MSKIIFEDDVIYRFGKLKKANDDWTGDKIQFNTAGDGATKILAGKWLKEQGIFDSDDFYYGKAVELGLYPRNMNIAICTERPGGKLKLEMENTVTSNGNKMNGLQDNAFNNTALHLSNDQKNWLKTEIEKKEDKIRMLEKMLYEKDAEYRKQIDDLRSEKYVKEMEIVNTKVAQARLEKENEYLNKALEQERKAREEIEKDREELNATLQDDTRMQGTMQLVTTGLSAAMPFIDKMVSSFMTRPAPPQPMFMGYGANGQPMYGYPQMNAPMNGQMQGQIAPPMPIPQQPNPNQYDMDSQLY